MVLGLKRKSAAPGRAAQSEGNGTTPPPAGQVAVPPAAEPAGGQAPAPSAPAPSSAPVPPAAAPARRAASPAGGVRQARLAQSFAQVVAVLMRDPGYKDLKLTDLEWLVLPPIMAGQFRLAHATRPTEPAAVQQGGILMPVAAVLWARVSPQVDKALSETLDKPVRLNPAAWTSGDILWLLAVAGDRRATPAFLKQLKANEFKDKQVKMRLRGPDGKLIVGDLGQSA